MLTRLNDKFIYTTVGSSLTEWQGYTGFIPVAIVSFFALFLSGLIAMSWTPFFIALAAVAGLWVLLAPFPLQRLGKKAYSHVHKTMVMYHNLPKEDRDRYFDKDFRKKLIEANDDNISFKAQDLIKSIQNKNNAHANEKNSAFIELLEDRRKEVIDYTEKYKELV